MKQPITDLKVMFFEDEVCIEIEASPTIATPIGIGATEQSALRAASLRLGRLQRQINAKLETCCRSTREQNA